MAQPWPPGEEPDVPDADLGTVKVPGEELAREWPDGPPGADYYVPPDPGTRSPRRGRGS
jgi:hypothetical protein